MIPAAPKSKAPNRSSRTVAGCWFAGEVEVWRHRAGLDCGDPAELPEPYRLEIIGDAEGAARWWRERDCGYDAALALAGSSDPAALRRALDMLHELGAHRGEPGEASAQAPGLGVTGRKSPAAGAGR